MEKILKFCKELVSDNNDINEKSLIGFILIFSGLGFCVFNSDTGVNIILTGLGAFGISAAQRFSK